MGWIWFKGIKTTKPAKTASLWLDTHSHGWASFLGRVPEKGGVQGGPGEPFQASRTQGTGWAGGGKHGVDGLHLLPLLGLGSQAPTLHLALQCRGAWPAAPGGPRKWPRGPSHPDAHLPLACCLGHLGPAQSLPALGPWAPNLGVSEASPRPTSRLRRGKEESLTATLLR